MATSAGELFVKVRPDTREFGRDLNREVEKAGSSAGQLLTDFISVGAVTAGFSKIIGAASELEQSIGGTNAVFGEFQTTITEFAEGADEAAGLSENAARTLTSQIGGLLQGFDFTQEEAAKTSIELAQLGADLAATFGGNPEDAVQALGAALRGEFDPLERFGISLNVTQANLKAVELGLAENKNEVDLNARAQAALAIITERSANAQGQFAREADTAAGAAAIASAKAENAAADLGENFLPIYTEVAEVVGGAAEAFSALPDSVQTATVILGAAAILAGPVVRRYREVAEAVGDTRQKFRDAGPQAQQFGKALRGVAGAAGGVFAVATALEALASAANDGRFGSAIDDTDRLSDSIARLAEGEITGALNEDLSGLVDGFGAIESQADDTDASLFGLAENIPGVGSAVEGLTNTVDSWITGSGEAKEQIDQLDKGLADLARRDPQAALNAFIVLRQRLLDLGVPADLIFEQFDDLNGVFRDAASGALGASDGIEDAGDAAGATLGDFKDLGSAIGDVVSEFEALDDAVFGRQDAELDLRGAQLDEEEAVTKARIAREEYRDAIAEFGPYSEEAQNSARNLREKELDLERAQLDVVEAQRDLNQQTREQAEILDNSTIPSMTGYLAMIQQLKEDTPATAAGIALVNEELLKLSEALGRQVLTQGTVGGILSRGSSFLGRYADAFEPNGRAGG